MKRKITENLMNSVEMTFLLKVIDSDFILSNVNSFPEKSIINKSIKESFSDDILNILLPRLEKCVNQKENEIFETSINIDDSYYSYNFEKNSSQFKITILPNLDSENISFISVSFVNLTQLAELEYDGKNYRNEYNNLMTLLTTAGLVIWRWDVKNDKTTASKGYIELYDFDPEKYNAAVEWGKRIHPDQVEGSFKALTDHLEGKTEFFQTDHMYSHSKYDDYIWISNLGLTVEYYGDGSPKTLMGIAQDITERENHKYHLHESLEKLEEANRIKSEFLATMSHEIRTPMNAILGLTHLALQLDLNEKQFSYISKIDQSAKSLLSIINDILDYSKIEAGKLELEVVPMDLDLNLNTISTLFALQAQELGIELIYEFDNNIPINLKGDPLRINQILNNLVSNSLKFTEKGEIVISVYKIDENDKKMIIGFSVSDTGVGIPESKLNSLFQSFQQADSSITRKYGGTGLGLTIVKNLITLMNGEISFESELNVGTTFKFTIELERSENEKNRIEKNLNTLKDMKILVCDDNETFRTIIKNTLQSFCFKVETVESGFDAINELILNNHDPYDLVLMDWNMPELDGIEASKFIKNNKSISKVPIIIMVSAYTKDDLLESAEQAGIDSFIVKPINHSTLFDSIMSVMGYNDIINTYEDRNSNVYDKTNLLQNKRILLVEDNEINQMVANDLLKNHGIIVEIADNGLKAIEKIKENGANFYDIVLMDLHMPVMDGYTATIELRKEYTDSELIILAMTADAMSGIYDKCIEVGMQDYITKPIDPHKLVSTLSHWLNNNLNNTRYIEKSFSANDHETMLDFKFLNSEVSIKKLNGNISLYKKLLRKFYNSYSNFDIEYIISLKGKEDNEYMRYFHNLKGVSGTVGSDILYKIARSIEISLLKDIDSNIDTQLQLIKENLDKIISELQVFLEK